MKAIFNIAEKNDKRYNIALAIAFTIGILPLFTLYHNYFDYAPTLFCSIEIIGLIGIYLVRYLSNDYKKVGKLIISDKKISKVIGEEDQALYNIKRIEFNFKGCFGNTTVIGCFPTKDGTGNIITFFIENNKKEEVNIYLDDRDEKKELVDSLQVYATKNGIDFEKGLLVSV